jgi:hypothetical protein
MHCWVGRPLKAELDAYRQRTGLTLTSAVTALLCNALDVQRAGAIRQ